MTNIARYVYRRVVPDFIRSPIHRFLNRKDYQRLREAVFPSPKGDFSLKPFDEHRCIFVHVTKTAGTSVAMSLFGYLPYHYTAREYQSIYGRRDFDRYFKFAFVRNPWDRLYSAFRYLKAGGWDDNDRLWAGEHLSQYNDFESFVMTWLTPRNIDMHVHFWPQCRFLCDRRKRLLVDYIGRFESLQFDFDSVAARLGIEKALASHNTNPGEAYVGAYTDEMKAIVALTYSDDIEQFDYQFAPTLSE